jgi:hypothetical protein
MEAGREAPVPGIGAVSSPALVSSLLGAFAWWRRFDRAGTDTRLVTGGYMEQRAKSRSSP